MQERGFMQVERKPSRWPYAVTLVYLLVLCLTVPRYWHSARRQAPRANRPAAAANERRAGRPMFVLPFGSGADAAGDAAWTFGNSGPVGPWANDGSHGAGSLPGNTLPAAGLPPTLDELLASLDALMGKASPDGNAVLLDRLNTAPDRNGQSKSTS